MVMTEKRSDNRYLVGLMVGALGVVYGDIGTSPLYAIRECFHGSHAVPPTETNVLGVLSLIFWSLVVIVSIKYLTFVIRADNQGEGGILAMLALASPEASRAWKHRGALLAVGVFGAALLYGDGMITPCVSILGAIEGLEVATPLLKPYIVPITIAILVALFACQHVGTGGVGKVFGPLTLLWFLFIAALGVRGIWMAPKVLAAVSPHYALNFLLENGFTAFVVLGAVFLVVTGSEALYADLGHFGARPIRLTWFAVPFPALLLNYLGQGALLLQQPATAENPFYYLAPRWALYPLVMVATMASVIASQALISGVFSITMQAIQLGYLPRMEIRHTSSRERGQIYMPLVNVTLMLCCIGLVLGFQSSTRLAAAYGIAVTLTMVITTVLFYFASQRLWNWSAAKRIWLCAIFLLIELTFFGANALKILHGGWFPLVVATAIFTVMTTWKTGRRLLRERLFASMLPQEMFVAEIQRQPPLRVRGTAVFMSGNPNGTPLALLHNLKHNKVLHDRTVLLTILTADTAHIDAETRVQVEPLSEGLYRVLGRHGFMDEASMTELIAACQPHGLIIRPEDTTFFLSRETILPTARPGMALWREKLFAFLARNAQPATAFFRLPANRVVELGMQVEF
ncbi:MAG: potassium transporter Kup [Verrucomicrobia bacterium]|nr:potassium transporter Kup [Verrucomicrobiota bacterium]